VAVLVSQKKGEETAVLVSLLENQDKAVP